MAKRNLNDFKELIERQIAELNESLPTLEEAAKPVAPDNALGRLTRMDLMQGQKINEVNFQKAQIRLKALYAALDRIMKDPDEFGICISCEEEISLIRLQRAPETVICVSCASNKE